MKRKLLDASLIVFGTALLVRLTVAFAPHSFHLPRTLREDSNAVMVISAALATTILLAIFLPRITRIQAKTLVIAGAAVALVGSAVAILVHVENSKSVPQVTWDDGGK